MAVEVAVGRFRAAAVPTRLLSLILLTMIWEVVARLVGSRLLPPASSVALVIMRETASGALPRFAPTSSAT